MTVKTGSVWAGTFVTLDATGALAAGTPSGVLYVNGVANAAEVTISGTNPYKWSVTLPTLTAGQRVDIYITATINEIATAAVVASEQADTGLVSDVQSSLLEAAIAAVPALDAAGVRNAVGLAAADLDAQLSAIQADLDNPDQYKANVSSLATSANLAVVDGIVDAIKLKTDNLPSDPADHSILAAAIAALPQGADYTQARAVKLDYLDAAISSRATSGEGTISWTYTLTESDGVTPIQFATVWVTSDISGQDIEASGQTDASGEVTFMLNAGTYYIWRKKRGFRFDNPDTEVVTA